MRSSYWIAGILAVAAAGWVASGQFTQGSGAATEGDAPAAATRTETPMASAPLPLTSVQVRTVHAAEKAGAIVLFGRTEAERAVSLRAETAGQVVALTVERGQAVRKGDVIARLAMNDRQARLEEAKALVEQRRLAYKAAAQLSEKAFRSRVQLAQSKADMEAAQATLEAIRLDIAHTAIRAPFDGVIEDNMVEQGDYLKVGDTVARLVDLDPILVTGEVSEQNIGRIDRGSQATATLVGGRTVEGTIRFVSRDGDDKTRTFRVEVAIPNPDRRIVAGLTAQLRLPTAPVRAHRMSSALLTLSDDGRVGIKAVDADGRVVFHPVSILTDTPEGIWLLGLPDTLTVITVGQEFVRTGQRVRPVPEAAVKGGTGTVL